MVAAVVMPLKPYFLLIRTSEGFPTSFNPSCSISKIPSSAVAQTVLGSPEYAVHIMLVAFKSNTVSTICSSILGPGQGPVLGDMTI